MLCYRARTLRTVVVAAIRVYDPWMMRTSLLPLVCAGLMVSGCTSAGSASNRATNPNNHPCHAQRHDYRSYERQMTRLTGKASSGLSTWFRDPATSSSYSADEKQVLFRWAHTVDNSPGCFSQRQVHVARLAIGSPILAKVSPSPVAAGF